jgi:hypothetical protein
VSIACGLVRRQLGSSRCRERRRTGPEAVAFAKRCIHVLPEGLTEAEIEVRQVVELGDFSVDPAE